MTINKYLNDLKKEQALYPEYTKAQDTLDSLVKFTQGSKEIKKLLNLENQQTLSKALGEMETEIKGIYKANSTILYEYERLSRKLNSGNLRNVVNQLIMREGMTFQSFAERIGYSEQHIISLTRDGIVSMDLLDAICNFFKINKTEDFLRYVKLDLANTEAL